MNDDLVQAVREDLGNATPGLAVKENDFYFDEIGRICHELTCWPAESAKAGADSALFQNAPAWLAALADRVEALEALLDRAGDMLDPESNPTLCRDIRAALAQPAGDAD